MHLWRLGATQGDSFSLSTARVLGLTLKFKMVRLGGFLCLWTISAAHVFLCRWLPLWGSFLVAYAMVCTSTVQQLSHFTMLTIAICFIILGEKGEIKFPLGWKREFSNATITNEECWREWKRGEAKRFFCCYGFCSVLFACLLILICFFLWEARQRWKKDMGELGGE